MKHHATQREYWRSLEHLAATPEITEAAKHEFGSYDPDEILAMPATSRRKFMQIMGASMALAGLTVTGCRRWPEEKLAPYTAVPKNRMPGIPEQYATVYEINGVAQPLLVTSFDGRPIKVEGNPTHPFSQIVPNLYGAATTLAQASVLDLYDPSRSRAVLDSTSGTPKPSKYEFFASAFDTLLGNVDKGERFAILSQSTSSPTTARLKAEVQKKFPKASWHEYEALSRDNEIEGAKLATGQAARPILHLDKADVIVSFDADFLGNHPAQVKYANDWAKRRRSADDDGTMSRMYVFETALTLTGSVADLREPVKPSQMMKLLSELAGAMGVSHKGMLGSTEGKEDVLNKILGEVDANKGKMVVVVGAHLPPEAHQLAMLINSEIGAIGNTVTIAEDTAGDRATHLASITDLAAKLKSGSIDTLLILGGNPAYDAPADLDFGSLVKKVANTVHLGHYADETAALCKWHVPQAHYLESWGDARAWDGSLSIVQPLIQPLFDGKTVDEILAVLAESAEKTSDAIVRKTHMRDIAGDGDWRKALDAGVFEGSASKTFVPRLRPLAAMPAGAVGDGLEVRFMTSQVYDGRFANNGWLQELPEVTTKMVWDNAALISKIDADKAGITTGDLISVTIGDKAIEIAAYVLVAQPVGVIGLPLGYGRTAAGPVGNGVGFNTYALRTTANMWSASGVKLEKTGGTYLLSMTQNHQLIDNVGFDGREERTGDKYGNAELIREASLEAYKKDKNVFHRKEDGSIALQIFQGPENQDSQAHAWGMAVDMTTCIGCSACVIACQAENNIPIVGKDHANNNRAMHWIRIDRYYRGDAKDPANDPNPEVVFQPVMCQHCENAPCEQVCPVGATMHDTEGLNVMVYNRCIGTRYCSNNCPYKVRRFNYLDWQSQDPRHNKYPVPYLNIPDQQQLEQVDQIKRMVFNPEVTVRMRGVMEKCTYCIQRIHTTQTAKRARGEQIADGDIITACQQTCPTQALVFGDLNDKTSRVSQMHAKNRSYSLLADLNTRPRTQYLGRVTNRA